MSPHLSSYGETAISTPNIDQLAAQGVRFTDAIVTGPICSPSRSALMTGMYQTSIGAHHHRSGRGKLKIRLPEPVQFVPGMFKDAGYQVLNLSFEDFTRSEAAVKKDAQVDLAKTDYNFEWDEGIYDRTHWSAREPGQPFFVQVQLKGGKLRGASYSGKEQGVRNELTDAWPTQVKKELGSIVPRDSVQLPPYLPDAPVIREEWAQYLDAVRYTDREVGRILERLEQAGKLENTYVFFITDHGVSHVRNKQFLYEGGIHIPLIIRGPRIEPGTVRTDVVEHIDMTATSLALAGIEVPRWMQARNILAEDYLYRAQKYGFSARDRADETVDRIRAVRSTRYKYIRNFYPKRPYLEPNAYKDATPFVLAMRRLYAEGKLTHDQALIMAKTRPAEELYDLQSDPYELHNLAEDSAHQRTLQQMRQALESWIAETGDQGQDPESWARYDSNMKVYLRNWKGKARYEVILDNIELMKHWAAEGK